MDEFALIRHLAARVPTDHPTVRVSIGDDAAVFNVPTGEEAVVTTDAMVEGVHFIERTMTWTDVGYKAAAVSISDVAAMGGQPRQVLLTVAIPRERKPADLEAFYDGMAEACNRYGCAVIGGDVVRTSGPLVVTSTVLGAVPHGQALLRSGARPGDVVFVTGTVGGSGAGLRLLLEGAASLPPDEAMQLRQFHRRPVPQVEAGAILREAGASSCDDISDGLASELNELAEASRVRLRIDQNRVPVHPAVRNFARARGESPLEYAWYGGEDFQLVGTAPPFAFARALARCQSVGISLTQIGRVEEGDGVVVESAAGLTVLEAKGYNHFRAE
ncbi:thiamine-phosphate kinase [Alicyclobacillus contaminans]|uniref:thiamine-phosphate kinase n=1 Tax=Alicyclobacillus contaminans TaxID=392016 RepID=UPI00047D72DD|nr:thiamine-phosphate kinase [Alicyclobacillus contaminans]